MYNLNDLRILHLEVTSKCQASCPMCARNIQGGVDNPFMTLAEITLEEFQQWFNLDFIRQLDKLYMCGNLGDPVVAKDTVKIFQYVREHNPNISLSMNTNGSARTPAFWEKLAELKVRIRFGIDGLQDTHHLYRIGTEWSRIIDNARTFISAGGEATWDMLIFEHNKHQVEACRELSVQLGFVDFFAKNTARFKEEKLIVINKRGTPTHTLYPTDRSKEIVSKESTVITCKVQKENSMYVSATGIVSPCCWLENEAMPHHNPSRIDYMEKINIRPNLHTNTLEEIFNQGFFNKVRDTWSCNPLKECSRQCGEVDRFNEQFK